MSTRSGVVIYHNPRCTKSRETLALLRERGIEPEIVEYLQTPPTVEEVKRLVKMLGVDPHAILRKGEAPYRELGLSPDSDLGSIAEAVAAHPVLLERPVVVKGGRAALGRPPENVLSIL